jgi:hypothetical protein
VESLSAITVFPEHSWAQHHAATVEYAAGYLSLLLLDQQLNLVSQPMICGILFGLGPLPLPHGSIPLPKSASNIVAGFDCVPN